MAVRHDAHCLKRNKARVCLTYLGWFEVLTVLMNMQLSWQCEMVDETLDFLGQVDTQQVNVPIVLFP